jgi:hypothetical protein
MEVNQTIQMAHTHQTLHSNDTHLELFDSRWDAEDGLQFYSNFGEKKQPGKSFQSQHNIILFMFASHQSSERNHRQSQQN